MTDYKFFVMCGGDYDNWTKPRQLTKINGEPIVARTIRLLRQCGVKDIVISSNNPAFENFGVAVLHHDNPFHVYEECGSMVSSGNWSDGFYPTLEPACYLFGDVVFSPNAIKTIVETETDSIEFFASARPFGEGYTKPYEEPFAFKVKNQKAFREAIDTMNKHRGWFRREPIAWELWQVIKGTEPNVIQRNYVVINDYTCDIDSEADIERFTWIDTRC